MLAATSKLCACSSITARMRRSSVARTSRSSARTLSSSCALAGMTLLARPALSAPTVTTAACSGSTLRDTTVCSAITMLAAATSGSVALCGIAPWPPTPVSVTLA